MMITAIAADGSRCVRKHLQQAYADEERCIRELEPCDMLEKRDIPDGRIQHLVDQILESLERRPKGSAVPRYR